MTVKEFKSQMLKLVQYYRYGGIDVDGPTFNVWYQFLKDLNYERFKQVVNFYMLTQDEFPYSPRDLMQSYRVLELAEQVLNEQPSVSGE